MAPKTMKAIKMVSQGQAEVQDAPIPSLRDDYVLVKVKAVALNPTDWKHVDYAPTPGATVGCDFAGVVEEVGAKVQKPWKKGDRIAGFTHGCNEAQLEDGSFAEYLVAKGDLWMKVPDNLTDEEAATLGVGVTTVGQSLYQSLGLPLPDSGTKADCPILIYGGSSATGSLAIQYARLSGCTQIITTCSPRNFDFVKSLGAHVALDYRDPDCAKKIRELTNDSLAHVLDCITSDESVALCQAAVGSKGGTIAYLLRANKHERTDVQAKYPLGYTVIGEGFSSSWMKAEFPASAEDFEFGKVFWQLSEKLFAEGKLRVHPPQAREGGLRGVFDGFQAMREGKVSGVKLVYRVEDTKGLGVQK